MITEFVIVEEDFTLSSISFDRRSYCNSKAKRGKNKIISGLEPQEREVLSRSLNLDPIF